jgi:hypothetical protein
MGPAQRSKRMRAEDGNHLFDQLRMKLTASNVASVACATPFQKLWLRDDFLVQVHSTTAHETFTASTPRH